MKVYHPEGSSQTLMVAPAALMPEVERPSHFLEDGKPKRFDLRFEDGVCEVSKELGEWLIEHGHANRTALKRVFNKLVH